MGTPVYILRNGQFILKEELLFLTEETDSFLFTEKLRAVRNLFPFFTQWLEVVRFKCLLFNLPVPEYLTDEAAGLKRQLDRTLVKNKLFNSAILQVRFYLANGQLQWIIFPERLPENDFQFNTTGLHIDVFPLVTKSISPLSNLDIGSDPLWKIMLMHKPDYECDLLAVTNPDDSILEIPGSNLYFLKNNQIYTASVESGAYIDPARQIFFELFEKQNFPVRELDHISINILRDADELFLADSLFGIRWIIGFQEKRYFNKTSRLLSSSLNNWVSSLANANQ